MYLPLQALQRAFSAKARPGAAAMSLMQAAAGTGGSPRPAATTAPSSNGASGAPRALGSSSKAPQGTAQQQGQQAGAGGAAVGVGRLGGLTANQEAELAAAAAAVSGLEVGTCCAVLLFAKCMYHCTTNFAKCARGAVSSSLACSAPLTPRHNFTDICTTYMYQSNIKVVTL